MALASEFLPLMGGAADLGMEAEALLVDTAHGGRRRLAGRDGLQAQHLLPRPGPEGNAVGAGRRPQGPEREIRIAVGEVAHALLFDEEALAGQELHPVPPQSCTSLCIRFMSPLMIRRSKACSSLGAGARTAWNTGTPAVAR
ncbi:MAG: hypothetical protein LC776_19495 [Acidobacteria bacterium]|nr:hypothetical protein [Acidobacteriota bacterium]